LEFRGDRRYSKEFRIDRGNFKVSRSKGRGVRRITWGIII
jgi:hypothetical protein